MERREVEPNGVDEDWDNVMIDNASSPADPQSFQFNPFQHQPPPFPLPLNENMQMQVSHPADCDMDTNTLIQQFNCLGTTDKDVLVLQLQKFIGPSLNKHAAQFFLDMNNWNLQRAIGTYFDLTSDEQASWSDNSGTTPRNYSMALVDSASSCEVTVSPNSKFSTTWRLMNNGTETWPPGTHLKQGTNHLRLEFTERVFLQSQVHVGETREVIIENTSPPDPGTYLLNYQLTSPEGYTIGNIINLFINVISDETVDLSQQFQNLRWNGETEGNGTTSSTSNIEMS